MTGRIHDTGHAGAAPADPFEATVGLLGILRILFKWSFVIAPLCALTVWAALSQSDGIDPEHTAEISMILIGPNEVLIEDIETGEVIVEGVNPLDRLGGTLATVARVTVLSLSDPEVSQRLLDEGLTDEYEIGTENRSSILIARAFDSDPDRALATVDRIAQLVVEDLASRQDNLNAPEANRIGAQLISKGAKGGPDFGARDRMRLAIAAVGFAASIAVAFFLEGLTELWRRRVRRKAARESDIALRGLPSGAHDSDRVATSLVASFDDLYTSEGHRLVHSLHFLTGDETFAEEVAAETFERASEAWPVPTQLHPIVWLYGEAVGRAWLTRPGQEHDRKQKGSDDGLWDSVLGLPTETRAVLALSHIAELTNEQVADALSIGVHSVEAHRVRAARHLRSTQNESAPLEDQVATSSPTGNLVADTVADDSSSTHEPETATATSASGHGAGSASYPLEADKASQVVGPKSAPARPATNKEGTGAVATSNRPTSATRSARQAAVNTVPDDSPQRDESAMPIADTAADPKGL